MERIRRLREAKGLSLRELAVKTGVSAPMLSQVERGSTSPTIQIASKIASGLDLKLSQLLRLDEEQHSSVVRAGAGRTVRRGGHAFTELTPTLPGQPHTVTVHTLRAGTVTGGPGDPPLHEAGSRETVVVQTGTVTFVCGQERFVLLEGDAVTFDADLAHHFENTGKKGATFMAVVTTGLRRS